MSRRLLAAAVALVLTIIGTLVIVSYVAGADERAMSDLEPVKVLVVTEEIPKGTSAGQLADRVALETVPASAKAPGALSSLDEVSGQVVETELATGEQLPAHRFVEPDALAAAGEVEAPAGMHQITVRLDRTRVVGGHLLAGEKVGIFVSLEGEAQDGKTHLMDHNVLVTRVQGGVAPPADPAAEPAAEPAAAAPPAETILVTLALDAPAAEKVVYAAEYERIWLSLEGAKADASGAAVATRESLYK
ncbi:RcpC/CpaB family pilus assembly protein [Janibacter cremeus]|uniref:Flp pilus assembly protein CpaB n=1 Tax=Janibacter cremeus TaxID=1285192 RepID=UPI0023F6BB08|nr:RcpC/CpaB family pilus assembly protein [Janibacter cremeus]WEV76984.1 RcpC/CpaB family pilus assembly protein [Janibacter cremeus]